MAETITFRLDSETERYLFLLQKNNRNDRSSTIRNAIRTAAQSIDNELINKIDTLTEYFVDYLSLSTKHSDASADFAKRIYRIAAQGAIFSSNIASHLGVRDAAAIAYDQWLENNAERVQL